MKNWGRSLVVCLGLLCLPAAWSQEYTIQTIAGTGTAGFSGDNGPATAALLTLPGAVALDSSGNVYIADTKNHCVRKVSGGTITNVAGTGGTAGYSTDGTTATSALLSSPAGLAFDSKGVLYIADTGNHVIRKVSGSTITTVAGIAGQGGGYGGDNGAATSANLNGPTAIAFDAAGNMYIADNGGSYIRKVDATTSIITTFVGASGGALGTAGKLNAPNGMVFDASGALYIADSGNNRVAKYIAPSAFTNFAGTLVAGFSGDGGQAKSAQLSKPVGIAMDSAGNIYLTDTGNSRIRKITPDGVINTIAGSRYTGYTGDGGGATSAALNFPRSVAVSSNGTIYIADTTNNVVRALIPTFPAIGSNGVTNAASYATRISPGALASIFGTGFGSTTFLADDGVAWPTSTTNFVSVKVNGVTAPLYYVSPGQINFQVPWATPTGTANVAVVVNGGSSNTISVPVGTAAPGLFVQQSGAAIVQNTPDYSLNSAANPAPAGSTIVAYFTGTGPVSPAAKDATPLRSDVLTSVTSAYSAKIGTANATVSFAGLTPGFIGLGQMNIVVPPTLTTGVYPLTITIDGQTSNSATIAVK